MAKEIKPPTGSEAEKAAKAQRLAQALRANLRRRKAGARAVAPAPQDDPQENQGDGG